MINVSKPSNDIFHHLSYSYISFQGCLVNSAVSLTIWNLDLYRHDFQGCFSCPFQLSRLLMCYPAIYVPSTPMIRFAPQPYNCRNHMFFSVPLLGRPRSVPLAFYPIHWVCSTCVTYPCFCSCFRLLLSSWQTLPLHVLVKACYLNTIIQSFCCHNSRMFPIHSCAIQSSGHHPPCITLSTTSAFMPPLLYKDTEVLRSFSSALLTYISWESKLACSLTPM